MKVSYFPDTDTLHIALADEPGVEASELAQGLVGDYDTDGRLVALEIEHASERVDVRAVETAGLPLIDRAAA